MKECVFVWLSRFLELWWKFIWSPWHFN